MQKTRPEIGIDPHLQASEKMKSSNATLNAKSLREQLYEYILKRSARAEMKKQYGSGKKITGRTKCMKKTLSAFTTLPKKLSKKNFRDINFSVNPAEGG